MAIRNMMFAGLAAIAIGACGGNDTDTANGTPPAASAEEASAPVTETAAVEQLELHKLDCGTIEISDLDVFSTAGDYAGQSDTFVNTCWLVRHPEGDLLWDLGLPGMLTAAGPMEQGIFTVSLETTLADELAARGVRMDEIEQAAISHSHFDHIGQIDQVDANTVWLVHETEYAFMFPDEGDTPPDNAAQFAPFADLKLELFTGSKDVFGDGSVVIHETPGHTPGHTSLQVNLPETGAVFLTGDLYHRTESRELRRVPQFNADVAGAEDPGAQTRASMDAFEAAVAAAGGRVIIQHEPDDVSVLADVMR